MHILLGNPQEAVSFLPSTSEVPSPSNFSSPQTVDWSPCLLP